MNKTLIRAAAVINIVAASLIYVACSGDDGSKGDPGQAGAGCNAVPSSTVTGGFDIVCGGQVQGIIPPAPGSEGTCTVTPIGATGSFNVTCGGNNYVLGGAGGGGCTITEDGPSNEYVVFNCGGTPARIAKAWCGSTVYNPSRNACLPDGTLSEHSCGGYPWDKDLEFCGNNGLKDSVYTFCGYNSATGANIEYNPQTSFCWDEGSFEQKVEALCGAAKEIYGAGYFCQARASGETIMEKCELSSGEKVVYEETEICDKTSKKLLGSCSNIAYEPTTQFCQTVGTAKRVQPLCINSGEDTLKFEAGQFCGEGWVVANGVYAKKKKVYDRGGPLPALADIDGVNDTTKFTPKDEFRVQVGAVSTRLPLCFIGTAPTAGGTPNVADTDGKYAATEFCQITSGEAGTLTPGSGSTPASYSPGAAVQGKIVPRCGLISNVTALRGAYSSDNFCSLSNAITLKPSCSSEKYNPEIEFCSTSKNAVYSTCRARSTAPSASAPPPYDVDAKVCDERNNKLYDYAELGGKRWLLENVNYAGSDGSVGLCYDGTASNCVVYGRLYNYSQAQSVCGGIGHFAPGGSGVWDVPGFSDFDDGNSGALLGDAGNTDNLKKTGAGIWTPATAGTDEFKFAALPGGKASYTPAAGNVYEQSGISAFWWTKDVASGSIARSHNQAAAITFNSDNFQVIVKNQQTGVETSQELEVNKSSEFLSVRCVSGTNAVDGISGGPTCSSSSKSACTTQNACTGASGLWDPADGTGGSCDDGSSSTKAACSSAGGTWSNPTNGSCS